MRTDALVMPIPFTAPLSLVAGAGINIPSSVVDLLGLGVGQSPASAGQIIGTTYNQQFGTDFGIGDDRVLFDIVIGTGLVTANGCTLNLAMQAAPDTGLTGRRGGSGSAVRGRGRALDTGVHVGFIIPADIDKVMFPF